MRNTSRNCDYEVIDEAVYQLIRNPVQDDAPFKIFGYKRQTKRTFFYHLIGVLSIGIFYILAAWYPFLRTFKYQKCALITATFILVDDDNGNYVFLEIHAEHVELPVVGNLFLRYFCYQYNKYVWIAPKGCFGLLDELTPKMSLEYLVNNSEGLFDFEEKNLYQIYGPNKIEVEVKSYWWLFIEEVFNPFYIFQAFSVTLWFFDDYMIYAGCVLILTLFSVITALWQTKKQSLALHNLAQSSTTDNVEIIKRQLIMKSEPETIPSSDLVPGHIIVIPRTGCIMPCDAVLLTGNCIVNESMLTGESVPVMKTPPNESDELFDINKHKAHTIFSGTKIIQGRYYEGEAITARVVQTGFNTTKGSLVKSIMFPAPVGFKFYKDSLKFVVTLFIIAAFGMSYCLYLYWMRRADIREMIIRALDIITIVVPPALPAAMTVGTVYSQNRLKNLQIFCISPPRINICGKIKLACFDKTGTLTHEGLDLYTVVPCTKQVFDDAVEDLCLLDIRSPIVQAMASCHALTRIDGSLNGDPLDLSMFLSTNWILEETGDEDTNFDRLAPLVVKPNLKKYKNLPNGEDYKGYEIGILKQFQFSSDLQRMSVICRVLGETNMVMYTKGAPEKVQSMCLKETIPPDFENRLMEFTAQGFRVIGLAYKELPKKFKWKDSQKCKREDLECDLIFLGFLVMQNALKPETTPVISTLHSANVRTVMITGDNVMTAICVARDCGMIGINDDVILLNVRESQPMRIQAEYVGGSSNSGEAVINFSDNEFKFAMDGNTWTKLRAHFSDLVPKILIRATVFARFRPEQKTQLVKSFQDLDYIVSMVGDGANDCGALKAAHIGVSLSPAEASVAAPFTSQLENISCLYHLILEGRCALVTSFAIFKFMALYSLIQFFTIILLYVHNSILGDQQFLFIDLIITTSLAVTLGRQGPGDLLVPKRPMGSLMSAGNLVPMLLQIFFCAFVQYAALFYVMSQKWFVSNPPGKEEIVVCWENTVLFTVSSFQYVILAVVYSKGKPHRENVMNNFWLLVCALSLTCFTTYLCIYPSKPVAEFFEVMYLPLRHTSEQHVFRDSLLLFPICHFIIAIVIELIVAESIWLKRVVHFVARKRTPKNRFKAISAERYEFPFNTNPIV